MRKEFNKPPQTLEEMMLVNRLLQQREEVNSSLTDLVRIRLPENRTIVTRQGLGKTTGKVVIRRSGGFEEDPRHDTYTPQALIKIQNLNDQSIDWPMFLKDFCKEAKVSDFRTAEDIYEQTWPRLKPEYDHHAVFMHKHMKDGFAFRSARALVRLRSGKLFFFGDDELEQKTRSERFQKQGALDFDKATLIAKSPKLISLVAKMWHGRFGWLSEEIKPTDGQKNIIRVRNAFQEFLTEFNLTKVQGLAILEQFHESPADRSQRYAVPISAEMDGGAIGGVDAVDCSDSE